MYMEHKQYHKCNIKMNVVHRRYGLVAMTSASHAEGLRFDPGYLYV